MGSLIINKQTRLGVVVSLLMYFYFCFSRSKRVAVDSESSVLSTAEKNKAIEDGQNNNVEPAAYTSG